MEEPVDHEFATEDVVAPVGRDEEMSNADVESSELFPGRLEFSGLYNKDGQFLSVEAIKALLKKWEIQNISNNGAEGSESGFDVMISGVDGDGSESAPAAEDIEAFFDVKEDLAVSVANGKGEEMDLDGESESEFEGFDD
jgi:hypothetical protein